MVKNTYDLFADDQLAIDNKWVFGYDRSPEMLQKGVELQRRSHEEFLRTLNQFSSK